MARDIGEWLAGLGLGRYAEAFADNEIDLDAVGLGHCLKSRSEVDTLA